MQLEPHASRSILLADTDEEFLDAAKIQSFNRTFQLLTTKNREGAESALTDKNYRILALIADPKIDATHGVSVIRSCRIHRPETPIFFTYESSPPFSEEEKNTLGLQDFIKKPISFTKIIERIEPNFPSEADPSVDLKENRGLTDGGLNDKTVELTDDSAFVAIRAEDFMAGTKSNFDIFVRLVSGRYIKILCCNESFDFQRLSMYLRKGVRSFYLEKSAQARYVDHCNKLAKKINSDPKFAGKAKTQATLIHGEETIHLLKSQGLNLETIQFAQSFVSNVELFVRNSKFSENERVAEFFSDLVKYNDAVSVTIIASLLARCLKFDGKKSIQSLGIASLFHDIGLLELPSIFQEEDETQLSPEQIKEFHTHPQRSAKILNELNLDTIIIQAVFQHHERRNRKGFPAQLGAGSINKLAEIIGISDEFIRITKKKKINPTFDLRLAMERIFDEFSYDVSNAFRTVFFAGYRQN